MQSDFNAKHSTLIFLTDDLGVTTKRQMQL